MKFMVTVAYPLTAFAARCVRRFQDDADPENSDGAGENRPTDDPSRAPDGDVCAPNCKERRDLATAVAERATGRTDLKLTCLGTMPNPYRDDDSLLDTYADDAGNEYWFCSATGALIQVAPRESPDPKAYAPGPAGVLPVKELRDRAVTAAAALSPNFLERRSSLHPLEDNRRRRIYFFRWDDFSAPLRDSELPPFLQVAMSCDGGLVSFTNTLRD